MHAARTRAVYDGDDWIITGQKMFTTIAHILDRWRLGDRRGPEGPRLVKQRLMRRAGHDEPATP